MSQTFTVYGRGSILSTGSIYPPIRLPKSHLHSLGLVSLYTCNTVQNIYPGFDRFYYSNQVITIPHGCYEIDHLHSVLKEEIEYRHIRSTWADPTTAVKQVPSDKEIFSLKANSNTLKCEIESIYKIDFKSPRNIGSMLGFKPQILQPNIKHVSNKDIEIIKTTNIFVDTNITSGAYRNNSQCHSIFEFGLSVPPGFNLEKEPSQIIYFPVSVSEIDNITLRLVDHEGNLVQFSEDTYTSVRLHLKSEPWA